MGLDIFVNTDNDKEISVIAYHENYNDFANRHNLSRTFCNFMCRQHVTHGEPELDQIGKITGIDISPIYGMEKYGDHESIEFQLSYAESDEEREQINKQIQADRNSLKNNIDLVLNTVGSLIQKLSVIDDLDEKLDDGGHDTLEYAVYFADFNSDSNEGYTRNNFGQDLRNFKRCLDLAKSKGATTVWFNYG